MKSRGNVFLPGWILQSFLSSGEKIMSSIIGEAALDEYNLLILIMKIEEIMNNRPITALPSHPDDHLSQWFLNGVRRSRFKGSVDVIRYFDILGINTF